jgi:hypothetical protein
MARSSLLTAIVEDQRDALALLGTLVFWICLAIGASGGGDLSSVSSRRTPGRIALEIVISVVAFAICIVVPSVWPEHLDRAWQVGALVLLGLTQGLAVVFSVRRWWRDRSGSRGRP